MIDPHINEPEEAPGFIIGSVVWLKGQTNDAQMVITELYWDIESAKVVWLNINGDMQEFVLPLAALELYE